jgi:hypothetical protein
MKAPSVQNKQKQPDAWMCGGLPWMSPNSRTSRFLRTSAACTEKPNRATPSPTNIAFFVKEDKLNIVSFLHSQTLRFVSMSGAEALDYSK